MKVKKSVVSILCATAATAAFADTLIKWFSFGEGPLTVAVTSAVPCKVAVDGKLQGWTAGGSEPTYFRLVSGKGWRMSTLTSETTPHGIGYAVLSADEAAKVKVSDNVLGSAKFTCTEGSRWLYFLKDGKKLVFRANGTYRGFPTASLYCAKPGSVTVSWGGRKMTVKGEKPGYVAFSPVVLANADSIEFVSESGVFELTGVGFTTVADSTTAAMSFASSDACRNASFTSAKRVCDLAKMAAVAHEGIGLKSIDEKGKTVTIDRPSAMDLRSAA